MQLTKQVLVARHVPKRGQVTRAILFKTCLHDNDSFTLEVAVKMPRVTARHFLLITTSERKTN